jgi:lysophospholipase L1-like esterase
MNTISITRRKLAVAMGATFLVAGWRTAKAQELSTVSGHIVLLGDSIFDNGAYTSGEPDVLGHLKSLLPHTWRASLCAVDGARISGLRRQLERLPSGATHLIVSIGGNDALGNMDLLSTPVPSTAAALTLFDRRVSDFEAEYRAAITDVLKLRIPLTLCTIYNGNLEPSRARNARVALMMFNDAIMRTAFENSVDLIELRLVCSGPSDYANPIEPSGAGGRKIAQAIVAAVGVKADASAASRVFFALR